MAGTRLLLLSLLLVLSWEESLSVSSSSSRKSKTLGFDCISFCGTSVVGLFEDVDLRSASLVVASLCAASFRAWLLDCPRVVDLADSEAAVNTDAGREALEDGGPLLALSALLRLPRPTVGIVEEIDDFSKCRKPKKFDKATVHIASRDHVGCFAFTIDSFQRCRPAVETKLKISPSHSTHRYIRLLNKNAATFPH